MYIKTHNMYREKVGSEAKSRWQYEMVMPVAFPDEGQGTHPAMLKRLRRGCPKPWENHRKTIGKPLKMVGL